MLPAAAAVFMRHACDRSADPDRLYDRASLPTFARIAMLLAFGIGPLELGVVLLIVLLLFGNRLPGVMRSMGQGLVEFKKGMQGIEDQDKEGANKTK
jgi:sec-independent protein translocase protein TatA